jgi:hypothetical protein
MSGEALNHSRSAKAAPAATRPLFSGATLLKAPEDAQWIFHSHTGYRVVVQQQRADYETLLHLQTPFRPRADHEALGVWYGRVRRIDADGYAWDRRIHAVVDNFGDLVEVPE